MNTKLCRRSSAATTPRLTLRMISEEHLILSGKRAPKSSSMSRNQREEVLPSLDEWASYLKLNRPEWEKWRVDLTMEIFHRWRVTLISGRRLLKGRTYQIKQRVMMRRVVSSVIQSLTWKAITGEDREPERALRNLDPERDQPFKMILKSYLTSLALHLKNLISTSSIKP